MSYYKKVTDWVLTHHARRRIKERIDISKLEDYQLYPYIEELIKNSVIDQKFQNGDIRLINNQEKISFIIKGNIIKTVINHTNKKNRYN
ncbi:hypothetical protein [Malacoplasma muris]|uniref:hypothetical protein n=1 Tax=Malacoplasma muris TaxID=2119 RepID=UPI00398F7361